MLSCADEERSLALVALVATVILYVSCSRSPIVEFFLTERKGRTGGMGGQSNMSGGMSDMVSFDMFMVQYTPAKCS